MMKLWWNYDEIMMKLWWNYDELWWNYDEINKLPLKCFLHYPDRICVSTDIIRTTKLSISNFPFPFFGMISCEETNLDLFHNRNGNYYKQIPRLWKWLRVWNSLRKALKEVNNLLFIHTLLNLNRNSKVRAVSSLRTFTTPIPLPLTRPHPHAVSLAGA